MEKEQTASWMLQNQGRPTDVGKYPVLTSPPTKLPPTSNVKESKQAQHLAFSKAPFSLALHFTNLPGQTGKLIVFFPISKTRKPRQREAAENPQI